MPAESPNRSSCTLPASASTHWQFKLVLLLVSCAFSVLLAEGVLRLCFSQSLGFAEDERSLLYQYDPRLGWLPRPNSTNRFTASRTITVAHNRQGFRGRELGLDHKPRIIVVGDSFVWGYDVEASERFTDKLQVRHPEWDIYNLGVSGFGNDQEFLLLQQVFDQFRPALVLVVFCADTDHEDNITNVKPGDYFKPYFTVADDLSLHLEGVPVPKSARAFCAAHPTLSKSYLARLFIRAFYRLRQPHPVEVPDPTPEIILNMQRFVAQKGALFAVGVEGPHQPMLQLLEACHIPCVDLTLDPGPPFRYPSFGAHWTPMGHDLVAGLLEPLLTKLLSAPTSSPPPQTANDHDTREALAQFHLLVGSFRSGEKKTSQAIGNYRLALKCKPEFPEALASLAWELATSSDPSQRNGPEAVRLAERACQLTARKRTLMVGALAAAYAESGQFAQAVAAAEEAVKLSERDGDASLTVANKARLALYSAGKPFHQPSASVKEPRVNAHY